MIATAVRTYARPLVTFHGVAYYSPPAAPVWTATLTDQTADFAGPDIRLTRSGVTVDLDVSDIAGAVTAVLEVRHVGPAGYKPLWSAPVTQPGIVAALVGQGVTEPTQGRDVRLRILVAGPAAAVSMVAQLIPW